MTHRMVKMNKFQVVLYTASFIGFTLAAIPTKICSTFDAPGWCFEHRQVCNSYKNDCGGCYLACENFCESTERYALPWQRNLYLINRDVCLQKIKNWRIIRSCVDAELDGVKVPVAVRSLSSTAISVTRGCALRKQVQFKNQKKLMRLCTLFWLRCTGGPERADWREWCPICNTQCLKEAAVEESISMVAFLTEKADECRNAIASPPPRRPR